MPLTTTTRAIFLATLFLSTQAQNSTHPFISENPFAVLADDGGSGHQVAGSGPALLKATGGDNSDVFPRPLSPQVQMIYNQVMLHSAKHNKSPTPVDKIGTSGKFISQLITDGSTAEFAEKVILPWMMRAREEVLMTTFILSGTSPAAQAIKTALHRLNDRARDTNKKIRVYILFDAIGTSFFEKKPMSIRALTSTVSRAKPSRYHLPMEADLPYLDFRLRSFHKGTLGSQHSKMIVIDNRYVVTGSKNMDGDAAQELMAVFEGSVAESYRHTFQDLWREKLPGGTDSAEVDLFELTGKNDIAKKADRKASAKRNGEVPMLLLSRHTGRNAPILDDLKTPQNIAWLEAMRVAEKEVMIQTPDFTTADMVDAVVDAVRRGVSVTLVTSFSLQDTNERLYWQSVGDNRRTVESMYKRLDSDRAAKSRLRVCWFINSNTPGPVPLPSKERYSHIKTMLVDRKFMIFGSGNMDPQSWFHSVEVNLLVDDYKVTRKMMHELLVQQKSLKFCYHDKKI